MKQLPPWLPVIPESYHKDDDLYEAEQHAMISYYETSEYFLGRLAPEIERLSSQALSIWDKQHPIRAQYEQAIQDRHQLAEMVKCMMRENARHSDFICPVTMPIITSMKGDEQ